MATDQIYMPVFLDNLRPRTYRIVVDNPLKSVLVQFIIYISE